MASTSISMKPTLAIGQRLTTQDGASCTIKEYIGRGGQGEVYRVDTPEGEMALKWYHKASFLDRINSESFYKNIRRNVQQGIPTLSTGDAATQFIWPLKLVPWQCNSFGYLMKLFPSGYESLSNVILGCRKDNQTGKLQPVVWSSWFTMITSALNLVHAFDILHSKGLSYQDLNEGGVAMNMKNGDVLICDCDNVSPDEINLGIRGVMSCMAPEVVCGSLPNVQSDEYSLAVLLFRLFYHDHPMTGIESVALHGNESLNREQVDLYIYGSHPHYCLDRHHPVNKPHPQLHQDVLRLRAVFPEVLLDAFHTVFTTGVKDKSARLTATQWQRVLLQVRDSLVLVNGVEQFFFTPQRRNPPAEARLLCMSDGHQVLVMPGKLLYACHGDDYCDDFSTPIAKVIATDNPRILGLYNASGKDWKVIQNGTARICPNKGRMPLLPGMVISLGSQKIEVK